MIKINPMKKYIYISLFLLAGFMTKAQDTNNMPVNSNVYETTLVNMQWFRSSNISGFATDSIPKLSSVELGYHTQRGEFHRIQEAGDMNAARFAAKKITPIGKYFLYGNFDFEQSRGFDKSWADVIDPYNTSPMIFGSSIKAPYDWQSFGLNIKMGSRTQSRFMHGVTADYRVGELSRQRDPRTLTEFADYNITPGISYLIGKNTRLGLNFQYRFRKESMGSILTIQEDPMISYYVFSGLENFKVVTGKSSYASFERFFKNNYWGGDLQLQQVIASKSKLLISGGITKMNQAIEGDSQVKENPGNLNQYQAKAGIDLVVNTVKGIHSLKIEGLYSNSALDLNVQEYSSTSNPITGVSSKEWITLYTHKNMFISDDINGKVNYSYYRLKNGNSNEYRWMLGVGAEYTDFYKEYRIPYSTIGASRFYSNIKGAYQIDLKKNKNLHFMFDLGYAPSINTKTEDLKDNIYTQQVLNPDFENFYKKDFVHAQLDVRYELPWILKKTAMNLYVKAYVKDLTTIQSERKHLSSFGISIGILTR